MQIIYNDANEIADFDLDRFHKSLNKYDKVEKSAIKDALKDLHYDPMHYSVLVEIGTKLIPDEKKAKQYFDDHTENGENFERLRRITGYLVGSLERWNDGKKAEEHDRVKHNVCQNCDEVYSIANKDRIEAKKVATVSTRQNEYQKGA